MRVTSLQLAPTARYFFGRNTAAWRHYVHTTVALEYTDVTFRSERLGVPNPDAPRRTQSLLDFYATLGYGVMRHVSPGAALQFQASALIPFASNRDNAAFDGPLNEGFIGLPLTSNFALTVSPVASFAPQVRGERGTLLERGR